MRSLPVLLLALVMVLASGLPAQAQFGTDNAAGITSGHVHLNVSDVGVHERIWTELWDGELIEVGDVTVVRWPGLLLFLHEMEPTGGSQGTVMDHFGFKVRDVEPMLERWREAGYEVQSEFTGAEGFPNAYVVVPDDVRLELQEDPELTTDVIGYHIHWFTPQLDEILDWYVDAFGLTRRTRGSIETTTDIPGMNMSFGGAREARLPTEGRSIDRVGFEVNDLDAVYDRLTSRGVDFDEPPHDDPALGIRTAVFTDPSGVRVELTEGLDDL